MRLIDADMLLNSFKGAKKLGVDAIKYYVDNTPTIDLVRCGECKHRPIKDDPDGADYGFNIVEPTDRDDLCPCLVEDGWYSWMPEDNFYCGRGERANNTRTE